MSHTPFSNQRPEPRGGEQNRSARPTGTARPIKTRLKTAAVQSTAYKRKAGKQEIPFWGFLVMTTVVGGLVMLRMVNPPKTAEPVARQSIVPALESGDVPLRYHSPFGDSSMPVPMDDAGIDPFANANTQPAAPLADMHREPHLEKRPVRSLLGAHTNGGWMSLQTVADESDSEKNTAISLPWTALIGLRLDGFVQAGDAAAVPIVATFEVVDLATRSCRLLIQHHDLQQVRCSYVGTLNRDGRTVELQTSQPFSARRDQQKLPQPASLKLRWTSDNSLSGSSFGTTIQITIPEDLEEKQQTSSTVIQKLSGLEAWGSIIGKPHDGYTQVSNADAAVFRTVFVIDKIELGGRLVSGRLASAKNPRQFVKFTGVLKIGEAYPLIVRLTTPGQRGAPPEFYYSWMSKNRRGSDSELRFLRHPNGRIQGYSRADNFEFQPPAQPRTRQPESRQQQSEPRSSADELVRRANNKLVLLRKYVETAEKAGRDPLADSYVRRLIRQIHDTAPESDADRQATQLLNRLERQNRLTL